MSDRTHRRYVEEEDEKNDDKSGDTQIIDPMIVFTLRKELSHQTEDSF